MIAKYLQLICLREPYLGDSKERPFQLIRIEEKRPSLRVRRKKISSGSGVLKRNQTTNIDKNTDKSEDIYCSDIIRIPGKKQR